ncbi:MAG: rod shape-determining protein MreD [Candidatus Delongbacteria bacterium]|nr:rod shape-determining protein MreD [Candidatus Delongbacteria bacterium]MCG2760890.1 rod shape-determining protein MreD [Candidatus Delongbacteria bacterium]
MIRNHLRFAVFLLFIMLIGIKFSYLYSICGIKPDLLLVFLIRKSLNDTKPQEAVMWGFFTGLILDLIIGDVIGISSLTYSIVCFFVSFYKRSSAYIPSYKRTLIYIISISFSALLIYPVTLSGMPLVNNFISILVPSAVYTMAIAVILQTFKPTK